MEAENARLLPQVIEMRHRDRRQPLILGLAVLAVFSLQNTARGGTAQVLVGLIDGGQQFEVGTGIALRKAMTPVRQGLERSAFPIASDQPSHLRPAQARHLRQITAQQTARLAALLVVLLPAQYPARASDTSAFGFRLRIGSRGWRLEKPRSVPGSVSLLRARGWSILSMPSAPGSSCVG